MTTKTNTTFAMISPSRVVFNKMTGLFPYSPRDQLDQSLILALKREMEELGFWNPILIRTSSYEGIAGNHRFVAFLEYIAEQKIDSAQPTLPAILIDCDENIASIIGLAEKEVRLGLSDWEYINQVIDLEKIEPESVEKVFNINIEIINKFKIWREKLYSKNNFDSLYDSRPRLDRDWLNLINEYLKDHPLIKKEFLDLLSNYDWVKGRSLISLKNEVLRKLAESGVRFSHEYGWNAEPTKTCLRNQFSWSEVKDMLTPSNNGLILPNDTLQNCCPFLQIRYVSHEEFIPSVNGNQFICVPSYKLSTYPSNTISDGKVRGFLRSTVNITDAFCIDADWRNPNSCFKQEETKEARRVCDRLVSRGEYVILKTDLNSMQQQEKFVWYQPHQTRQTLCNLDYCIRSNGTENCGYRDIIKPPKLGQRQCVCINEECGAKHKLEIETMKIVKPDEMKNLPEALATKITSKILKDGTISLQTSSILEQVESVLLPDWKLDGLFLLAKVWKTFTLDQIRDEVLSNNGDQTSAEQVFGDKYPWFPTDLHPKIGSTTLLATRQQIRKIVISMDQGYSKWIILVTLVVKCSQYLFSQKTEQDIQEFARVFYKAFLGE